MIQPPFPRERTGEPPTILSTTYFGPVQWYQKLYRSERVMLEACESFIKQTYRNRCIIATTNGLQALTVPVEHSAQFIRDLRISSHGSWRRQHWNALQSAYSESPFFEYYADDLRPFFERDYEFLYDFNLEITQTVCRLLDIQPMIEESREWNEHPGEWRDFRYAIAPKHAAPDPGFQPRPYYQVFAGKHGFQPNLSVLDLLFNMGPEGIFWL